MKFSVIYQNKALKNFLCVFFQNVFISFLFECKVYFIKYQIKNKIWFQKSRLIFLLTPFEKKGGVFKISYYFLISSNEWFNF